MPLASAGILRYFGGGTVNGYYTFYRYNIPFTLYSFTQCTHWSWKGEEYEWLFTCITKLLSKVNRAVKIPKMFKLFKNTGGRKAYLCICKQWSRVCFRPAPSKILSSAAIIARFLFPYHSSRKASTVIWGGWVMIWRRTQNVQKPLKAESSSPGWSLWSLLSTLTLGK